MKSDSRRGRGVYSKPKLEGQFSEVVKKSWTTKSLERSMYGPQTREYPVRKKK